MKYDKDGLPIKEYYTEELEKSVKIKMQVLKNQKYFTAGSIILMFVVLICMYFLLSLK